MFGSNDPLVYSSVALYNACNQEHAQLYDHGLGHLVPRDADNVEQLGDVLSVVIGKINKPQDVDGDVDSDVDVDAELGSDKVSGSGTQTPVSEFAADGYTISSSASSSAEDSGASSTGLTAESELDLRASLDSESEGIVKIQLAA